jgi:lysophospholipase L1-like esterase
LTLDLQKARVRAVLTDAGRMLLGLCCSALLLEGALRLAFHRSLDFSMEMWKYAVALKQPVSDPKLSFVHRANTQAFLMGADVRINSQGLRDDERTLKKQADTFRILLLGDSTTFGWGVPEHLTSAKLLERELSQRGPRDRRFEVINAGVGNYGTVQESTYYQTRGRAFAPDLVILVYFINDAEPVPRENRGLLLDRSYLLAFVSNRFDGVLRRLGRRPDWKTYYASLYDDAAPGFLASQRAFRDLVAATRSDHTPLLVALLPELRQINAEYPFAAQHQKLAQFLTAERVPTLDLLNGLRNRGPESELWVTPLDDHPNGKANALVASQLGDWVLAHLHGSN